MICLNKKVLKDTYTKEEVFEIKHQTILSCTTIFLMVLLALVLALYAFVVKLNTNIDLKDTIKIAKILQLYNTEYLGEFDTTEAVDNAIYNIVSVSKDKYGTYIPAKYQNLSSKIFEGNYTGFGFTLLFDKEAETITIMDIKENSPAHNANLQIGQQITLIDNNKITEESYNNFLNNVKEGLAEETEFEIDNKFKVVMIPNIVDMDILKYDIIDNIAYIHIYTFVEKTETLFKEAIDNISNSNIEKIVFDLRGNTGGNAEVVVSMLDYITKNELIMDSVYANGEHTDIYANEENHLSEDIPIYILCNQKTASASELFIMCLQDTRNITLIGQQTYGKSTILTVNLFQDGSTFCFSSGTYYSKRHENIEDKGITPNIILNDDDIFKKAEELTNFYR